MKTELAQWVVKALLLVASRLVECACLVPPSDGYRLTVPLRSSPP